jgi:hypothetical protein
MHIGESTSLRCGKGVGSLQPTAASQRMRVRGCLGEVQRWSLCLIPHLLTGDKQSGSNQLIF